MQKNGSVDFAEPLAPAPGEAAHGSLETWVVFLLDGQKYALEISEVERIIRSVEVKPLPQSPPHVMGIINMQGRILPVIDLRMRFGRPSREIHLEDHFIVAHTPTQTVVLPVDAALGSLEVVDTAQLPDEKARDRCLRKIVPLHNDVLYTIDLEQVVFGDESSTASGLASALAGLQTA
jgi:purine-binding chemotaxis protein CheW